MKRRPAGEVPQHRGDGEGWIDHAEIVEGDASWLRDVEWLTLWNVSRPSASLHVDEAWLPVLTSDGPGILVWPNSE